MKTTRPIFLNGNFRVSRHRRVVLSDTLSPRACAAVMNSASVMYPANGLSDMIAPACPAAVLDRSRCDASGYPADLAGKTSDNISRAKNKSGASHNSWHGECLAKNPKCKIRFAARALYRG
jgi:hypothetical protein